MNIKHDNGRIFREGDGIADTISPYDTNFWDNIEDGIKPLIDAFMNKLYLPYSSCAGHPRMFVAIATNGTEEANKLQTQLIQFGSGIRVEIKGLDQYLDLDETGKFAKGSKRRIAQINFLNKIYMRGYANYMMVEITIEDHNKLDGFIEFVTTISPYLT